GKSSTRNGRAKRGHDISCPYLQNGCRWSCGDGAGGLIAFDFGEGGGAALADGWVAGVFANVGGVVPAAVAFFAVGSLDSDGKRRDHFGFEIASASSKEIHLRDDEEAGQ